jgi:hypothetical protein
MRNSYVVLMGAIERAGLKLFYLLSTRLLFFNLSCIFLMFNEFIIKKYFI